MSAAEPPPAPPEPPGNLSALDGNLTEYEIPYYIRATSVTLCVAIMCLGVVGNVLVPVVILRAKDMRNSTNIFLVNLSVADLLVLLVCTPTVLVEAGSKPDTWLLGRELCLAVPFVELTVTHASVLTILAISFERYYAICEPLRAGYVCTKARAAAICGLVWFIAALFTSPVLGIAEHRTAPAADGSPRAQCLTQALTFWPTFFFLAVTVLLYLVPLLLVLALYARIARSLLAGSPAPKPPDPGAARARRQLVLMLGTVVLCFFLCLMPYRALTLWIIITPADSYDDLTPEKWYNILYFSRVMLYLNSAINPILYNLMSSKFRLEFCRVCACSSSPERRARASGSTTSGSLTRTTNSLKKFFHRGSVDRSDAAEAGAEEETRSLFGRIFSGKRFVRQQSAPECSVRPAAVRRMRSEGALPRAVGSGPGAAGGGPSLVGAAARVEDPRSSLRRSVLISSAQARGAGGERRPPHAVPLQKSRSLDHDLPETFV